MSPKVQGRTVEDVLSAFRSSPDGLSDAEAARRLVEFGPNAIERFARTPPMVRLLRQLVHLFALILWVAAALALFAALRQPGRGMGTLAAAIVAVILINGLFSFWQERRAERALESLERLLPSDVVAVRQGRLEKVEARHLVPGDVFLVEGGQRVPADARVIEATALRVNNATLTGESVPLWRDARPSGEDDPTRASNILLAGTSAVSGSARALVVATGSHTEFARLARLAQMQSEEPSPLQREVVRVSRVIAILATSVGIVFFFAGLAMGAPLSADILFAIGLIVANVPEGLLPTLTLALAMAAQRMARRNVIVRHLPAVEALGATTTICTDKTGTLTENSMAVRALYLGGRIHDVEGQGRLEALARRFPRFFEIAFYCENITEAGGPARHELLGDPTEIALMEMARGAVGSPPQRRRVAEIPFDPDRRRLSIACEHGRESTLYTKGALEALLPLCTHFVREGEPEPLSEGQRGALVRAEAELAERGLRVLALAYRDLPAGKQPAPLEAELILVGLAGLEDPPRREVPEAIRRCREARIRVIMLTGDHPRTASSIARQIGLVSRPDCRVITGDEVEHMKDTSLQLALDGEVIFARLRAHQKTRIVQALRRKNEVVAVTGDGVNDAPALRAADIGIAMGRTGTDVARESADIVLADDNFASIVGGVEEGRAVYANIRKFMTYVLSSNVPELVPYLGYFLLGIPLPLTVIQVLAVDLGTDMLPALALGAEAPEPHLMRDGPRPRSERLLSWGVLLRAYGFLGVMEAAAAMAAYFFVLSGHGWALGDSLAADDPLYRKATSACLLGIVAMQVVNAFLCRSDRESSFGGHPFRNRMLLAGIALELLLVAVFLYTSVGHGVLQTAPLAVEVWIFLAPFALAMLAAEELRKVVVRRSRWRPAASRS